MATESGESSIAVVRQAVLEFLEEMRKSKRIVEQEIRDQSDTVLGSYLNQGGSQFTRADIQDISKKHREGFTEYYQNIIFLRIISNASKNIRIAIEEGFTNPQIIQDEWLVGIDEIKAQLSHMNELAENIRAYKTKIDEQDQVITELRNSSSVSTTDMNIYQEAIDERDQLIKDKDQLLIEKEQEIMNLNQGLSHMEDQSNNLGESLLQYNMQIEELQEAVNNKDVEIENFQAQLKGRGASDEELINLKNQLSEADNMIRKLEQEASAASTDLVNELEQSLEKTRSQVLELRREIVQKNERTHNLEIEKEEFDIKFNQLEERLSTSSSELEDVKKQLQKYEGKESISAEEKQKISSQVDILEDQINENKGSIEFMSNVIGSDIKFRTLFYLQSLNVETRMETLAQGVGIPVNVVHRVLLELERDELVEIRKDGRHLLTEIKDKDSPFKLMIN